MSYLVNVINFEVSNSSSSGISPTGNCTATDTLRMKGKKEFSFVFHLAFSFCLDGGFYFQIFGICQSGSCYSLVSEISMNIRLLVEKATFFLLSKTEASLNREKKSFLFVCKS